MLNGELCRGSDFGTEIENVAIGLVMGNTSIPAQTTNASNTEVRAPRQILWRMFWLQETVAQKEESHCYRQHKERRDFCQPYFRGLNG